MGWGYCASVQYYSGYQNKFWQLIKISEFTPIRIDDSKNYEGLGLASPSNNFILQNLFCSMVGLRDLFWHKQLIDQDVHEYDQSS
jgi:hypothetical protein